MTSFVKCCFMLGALIFMVFSDHQGLEAYFRVMSVIWIVDRITTPELVVA